MYACSKLLFPCFEAFSPCLRNPFGYLLYRPRKNRGCSGFRGHLFELARQDGFESATVRICRVSSVMSDETKFHFSFVHLALRRSISTHCPLPRHMESRLSSVVNCFLMQTFCAAVEPIIDWIQFCLRRPFGPSLLPRALNIVWNQHIRPLSPSQRF